VEKRSGDSPMEAGEVADIEGGGREVGDGFAAIEHEKGRREMRGMTATVGFFWLDL